MQIELFSFSKRKNSTKKPQGAGSVVSCALKEETSVLFPSFELVTNPTTYNYVKAFGFYYYVTDCTYVRNNLWRISCRIDELATWSDTIKATRAYIEYTDTYDSTIYDPRLAKKINASEVSSSQLVPFINQTGYCVATVIGKDAAGTFRLTYSNLCALMQNCTQWWNDFTNDHTWGDVVDSIKNTCQLLIMGSAAENIKGAKWIPANPPSGTATTIYAGMYNTGVSGSLIPYDAIDKGSFSISVPHPSNVMLRSSNTCEYSLFLPFAGTVSLSPDILADEGTLTVEYSLAQATGDVAYAIHTSNNKYLGSYGANISAEVPIGSSGVSPRTIATAVGVAAVGAATAGAGIAAAAGSEAGLTAGAVGSAATSAAKSAGAGLASIQGTSSSVGGIGSCAGLGLSNYARLTCSYWNVSDAGSNLTSLIGNPYYKADTIGSHGFVRCSGASVEIAGYDEVTNAINSYLQGGVYIE